MLIRNQFGSAQQLDSQARRWIGVEKSSSSKLEDAIRKDDQASRSFGRAESCHDKSSASTRDIIPERSMGREVSRAVDGRLK